jgi:ubiquinone/menaquinone biosynthesis C-methylase UbiE
MLDVARGRPAWALKKFGKAKEIVGIELVQSVAKRAESRLDKVMLGDVEEMVLSFQPEYFDYIIMGDVIEHVIDPWRIIKQLYRFFSREVSLIASIPKVGHWRVLKDLILFDKWEYQKTGIRGERHFIFFTQSPFPFSL